MAGTAKTRAALKSQSDSTFPTGTAEIVAVEERQFNEDVNASALNIVDPAAQIIVSKVDFEKQITSIGGLGKVTTFTQSVKADMQGVVPDLLQTGAWAFVKDPSVVNGEGLLNGLKFVFTSNGDAITFSADFDVVGAEITSGERYIFKCWWSGSKFIVVMDALAGQNYMDFIPLDAPPPYKKGRGWYDNVEGTHSLYNDLEGTSLQLGEELRARLTNDTGSTLLNGVAVAIIGSIGANLKVELLDASVLSSAIRALGLITLEAINGAQTYVVRFGAVRGLNTSGFVAGEILFADPATPGGLVNARPKAPNYPIRVGVCIISDAVNGVIGVDTLAFNGTDTTVNIEGALNGVVVETPLVEFYESGGNIWAEVTNQNAPADNLAFILDGVRYLLDTTTGAGPNNGATAQLVPGADAETLFENFIYVWLNGGTPELKVSTLSTPDVLAPIGKASIFDVTRTLAEGVYKWRRYNDAPDNGADDGFNRWAIDATRDKLGTTYTSGVDGTPTVNSTPSVKLVTTAGVAMQAHKGAFDAQDGNSYWVYNDETNQAVYEFTDDLASIVETALGASLAVNGAYYRLPVYGMQNSASGGALASPDKLVVTRPLGFYGTAAEALTDAANLDVVPNDIIIEGVLFKLYTLVIGRTGGGGGTWSLIASIDNRTRLIGGGGGGGASGGGGTDDKVRATAADTTNSYLNDKLAVTPRLSKTILNPAGNEQIELNIVVHDYGIIYLAKSGLDTNDGSEQFPVLTLQKAVDLAIPASKSISIIGEFIEAPATVTNIPVHPAPAGDYTLTIRAQEVGYGTLLGDSVELKTVSITNNRVVFINLQISILDIIQSGVGFYDAVSIRLDRVKVDAITETIEQADTTSISAYNLSDVAGNGVIDTHILLIDSSLAVFAASTINSLTAILRSSILVNGVDAHEIGTLLMEGGRLEVEALGNLEISTAFNHTGTIFVNQELINVTGSESPLTGEFADTPNKLDKVKTAAQTINSSVAVVGNTLTFTPTPNFAFTNGNVQKMIVTANITSLSISNELPSGSYRIFLTQNGTGGYTIPTPDATFGDKLDQSASFITAANDVNIIDIAIDPDGSTFYSIATKTA